MDIRRRQTSLLCVQPPPNLDLPLWGCHEIWDLRTVGNHINVEPSAASPGVPRLVMSVSASNSNPRVSKLVTHFRTGSGGQELMMGFLFIYIFLLLSSKFEICRVLRQLLSNCQLQRLRPTRGEESRFWGQHSVWSFLTPISCLYSSPISWENDPHIMSGLWQRVVGH